MPVQDDNKHKKEDFFFENDEDKRRQAVQTSQENSVKKSQKLLPIISTKAEIHQNRINTLTEKIAVRKDKIARNESKIEKLTAKADRLEDRNTILKNTLGSIPVVKKLIESNEKKIADIRENKIPTRQKKIEQHKSKITQLTNKRDGIEHKLNRVLALNDVLKSFSIKFNKERREVFTDAMDRLNKSNTCCLNDKISALNKQKSKLIEEYNNPHISAVDKYNLQEKITNISERIDTLEDKVHKLSRPDNHFAEQTNDVVDATMLVTSETVAEAVDKEEIRLTDVAENIFNSADKVEGLDKSEIARLADKLNHLDNAEVQLEDNYNSIDGIINNGSKAELEATKKELSETLSAMKDVVGNKYMMQSIKDETAKEIPKIEEQLNAVNKALNNIENTKDDYKLTDFSALIEKDSFKVNPEYYRSLSKDECHFESMTKQQSITVMTELSKADVQFSAVSRGNDKVNITVDEKDVPALNDIMQVSIGKTATRDFQRPPKSEIQPLRKINPQYFKSLKPDEKFTNIESTEVARGIIKELETKEIPYSAAVLKNDTVVVTVSNRNKKSYMEASSSIKDKFAEKCFESDKAVPKKQNQRAFFSRDKLKKEAQRIKNKGRQNTPTKDKHQGLE